MNRRRFTQSLGALFALPAVPVKAVMATPAVAVGAVPNATRFWAIYMSQMHGSVSAATLANMTGVSQSAAQGHLSSMIADGVIKPQNLIQRAVQAKTPKASKNTKMDLREKFKKLAGTDDPEPIEQVEQDSIEQVVEEKDTDTA